MQYRHPLLFLATGGLGLVLGFAAGFLTARPASAPTAAKDPDPRVFASPVGKPAVSLGTSAAMPTTRAQLAVPVHSLRDEEARQSALEKWAETDPKAALAYALGELRGDRQAQALSAILTIWARNDPASAWKWVQATLPGATHHFDTLLEAFGRTSPTLAAQYAAEYSLQHPEAALEAHLAALLGVTHSGDFAAARRLVAGNAALDPTVKANLNNFIAGQWARYAPMEAAAWVMTFPPGQMRDFALVGLGESWSDVNPSEATRFAASLPEGDARSLAMRQSISKWVAADPLAARKWVLDTHRHEDFDQAVQAIATETNLMSREPQKALLWASGIFEEGIRSQSERRILQNWHAIDPQAAIAYVTNSASYTAEQRSELLKAFPVAQ